MPTESFDPVEVAALQPDAIEQNVSAALAAFAAASSLDELKAARIAHMGDRSPLALANREIAALPPAARAAAGKRVGQARGAVNKAHAAREAELAAERDRRVLVEKAGRGPFSSPPPRGRARDPPTPAPGIIFAGFPPLGLGGARGP